jgi:hypothetical protein
MHLLLEMSPKKAQILYRNRLGFKSKTHARERGAVSFPKSISPFGGIPKGSAL